MKTAIIQYDRDFIEVINKEGQPWDLCIATIWTVKLVVEDVPLLIKSR
jgi:hypothetical protein